jgi:3-deoxy-D-manno-octulosonate 8-phosphate phosphatase (KDO 8-P phosphatase)
MTPHTVDLKSLPPEVVERARNIKLILMDVDGTLTDGRIFYFPESIGKITEFKAFGSHDGLGFHFCNHVGITTGWISGRVAPGVDERARILNVKYVRQGHLEKEHIWDEILADANLSNPQVAYIGDDFTDVSLMMRSGLGCAVGDARPEVRKVAHYVTRADGGQGAFREIAEIIIKSQGLWQQVLEKYKLPAS